MRNSKLIIEVTVAALLASLPAHAQQAQPAEGAGESPSVTEAATQQSGPSDAAAPAETAAEASPQPEASPDAASDLGQIEEIVVTAQKRSERAQDVPMAISAFDPDMLASRGARDASDLSRLVPSLNITQGGGVSQPFLRGVGNPSATAGNESSNAIYVDGVYYSRIASALFKLKNIDRVEVLKGPQGTLFGRNAVGGLIHILTKDPGQERELSVGAGYASYQTREGSAYFSTPLSDDVAVNFSAYSTHQGEGWGESVTTGDDAHFEKTTVLRSKLRANLGERTTVKLSADYSHTRNDIGIVGTTYEGRVTGNPPGFPPMEYGPEGFYDTRGNTNSLQRDETFGFSLNATHDLGFAQLVSITAYRHYRDLTVFDADFAPPDYFTATLPVEVEQTSQELQLVSSKGAVFDWLLGLYYLDLTTEYQNSEFTGSQYGEPGQALLVNSHLGDESYAGFGQATFHLRETTNLTLGLRYTRDEVEADGRIDFQVDPETIAGVSPQVANAETFSELTYKAVLDQALADSVKAYASYARGFKAGTFNALPYTGGDAVRPETLDAYELGLKSDWFERRLRLNGAVFLYKEKDLQVEQLMGAANVLVNAAAAEIKGAEIEANAILAQGLDLTVAAAVLDATYTDFKNAPSYPLNPDPPFGNVATAVPVDASGNDIVRSPNFTCNISLRYQFENSIGLWGLTASNSYNGGFYWTPDNQIKQKAFNLVNAQVTYSPTAESRYRVTLWGKNLTDEKYYAGEFQVGGSTGDIGLPASPLTVGISLDYTL